MNKIDIEDWIKRLHDTDECESDREQAVMDAIQSGLRASEPAAEVDQLALQRLHRRLAQEGLYRAPLKPRRSLQRYGYAAVLLVGLTIILDLSVFDRSVLNSRKPELLSTAVQTDAARYEVAASLPAKRMASSVEAEIAASADAMSRERSLADAAKKDKAQASGGVAKPSPSPERLAAAPPSLQSKTTHQEFAADTSQAESTARQKVSAPVHRLALTDSQWQSLRALSEHGISLEQGRSANHWLLLLSNETQQQRWRALLTEPHRNFKWPIGQQIELEIDLDAGGELRGDDNE